MTEDVNYDQKHADKKSAALNSVFAAVAITGLKIIVGITTGSLGILSEAAHSGLDLVATAITYFSVSVSDKPADADHQYGHGKVENFSAFIETGLLLLTCVWIVYEATRRLFFHSVDIEPSVWAFLVMGISIAVDAWRSRRLKRVAEKYDSQALLADALHFRTDIWSSSVVILGLALVLVGPQLPPALACKSRSCRGARCCLHRRVCELEARTPDHRCVARWRTCWNSLADYWPGCAGEWCPGSEPGAHSSWRQQVFRRCFGGNVAHGDVSKIGASGQRSSGGGARLLPDADVVVNATARASHGESVFDQIRAVATRNNLNVHDISVQDIGGSLHVEQHVELDERMSLTEAP